MMPNVFIPDESRATVGLFPSRTPAIEVKTAGDVGVVPRGACHYDTVDRDRNPRITEPAEKGRRHKRRDTAGNDGTEFLGHGQSRVPVIAAEELREIRRLHRVQAEHTHRDADDDRESHERGFTGVEQKERREDPQSLETRDHAVDDSTSEAVGQPPSERNRCEPDD
jgi:hypothetical protein